MLSIDVIQALLDQIQYTRRPSWRLRFKFEPAFSHDGLVSHATTGEAGRLVLQVVETAEPVWSGRKWLLSHHMRPTEVVTTAFKAIMAAEEHEIRETFTYKGYAVFGPHFDVEALVELAQANRVDVRDNAMQGA